MIYLVYFRQEEKSKQNQNKSISGNLVTLWVIFTTPLDFKASFLRLVATLATFDLVCIVLNMVIFAGPVLDETYRHQVVNNFLSDPWQNFD